MMFSERRRERRSMVRKQLAARGIRSRRVLAAMGAVPRELFLAPNHCDLAYADQPVPIGCGQTISQPYMVALMTEVAQLSRTSRVLEIGTGSGYHAAVMARVAGHVWTVERHPPLAAEAGGRLERLGIHNVTIVQADGAQGHPEAAPYDAIIVTAAAPHPPPALLDQLGPGGRLVIPVGNLDLQDLSVIERTPDGLSNRRYASCRFVPLVSPAAFQDIT
jgi:protein-L-isoaspartate(D-aspartate) O-methyltransferase